MMAESSSFISMLFTPRPAVIALFLALFAHTTQPDVVNSQSMPGVGPSEKIELPAPFATRSASNNSKVIGWPKARMPRPAPGLEVTLFAEDLDYPRLAYALPNEDVLVVEAGGEQPTNRITLFRDTNKDGKPDHREIFLTGLNRPYGMLLLRNWFYVGNTDNLVRYPYQSGQTKIGSKGEKILDLPAGGHYTRNLTADRAGHKIYIAVGSATNVDEDGTDSKDPRRAAILQVNPDGSSMRVFASGLRNPVGMDWEPETNTLWTVVNERDGLGDELVPDYFTSVRDGAFYGWPYSYFGQNIDPRKKGEKPDLVKKAIVPDYGLGSHVAALGLSFYRGRAFPEQYRGGAFIGMHGSWNHSKMVGYKVAFVRFENGKPVGPLQNVLTGFIAQETRFEVYGRPAGVTELPDGSLLVADDAGGKIWRIKTARP
jgi:glucose/arabinose dehydrogenase